MLSISLTQKVSLFYELLSRFVVLSVSLTRKASPLQKVAELKQRLSALGLPTDGKKAVLVERMQTRPLTASRKGNKA